MGVRSKLLTLVELFATRRPGVAMVQECTYDRRTPISEEFINAGY